jgi:tetratricopeptide (TPR) repeat protein
MSLSHIKQLYEKGQLEELLDYLKQIEEKNEISQYTPKEQIEFLYYKRGALGDLNRYKEAYMIVKDADSDFNLEKDRELTLSLCLIQWGPFTSMSKYEQASQILTKAERIINNFTPDELNKMKFWVGFYYRIKGWTLRIKGEYDEALPILNKSLTIFESLKNFYEIQVCLSCITIVYFDKNDDKKAKQYLERLLSIDELHKNDYRIGWTLNYLGIIFTKRGDYDTAINYYQQGFAVYKKIGNPIRIAVSLSNLSMIFDEKGELDQALKYGLEAVKLHEKLHQEENQEVYGYVGTLGDIGSIYHQKGDINQAKNYYQRSLTVSGSSEAEYYEGPKITALFGLLLLSLEEQDLKQAQAYLQEIQTLDNKFSGSHAAQIIGLSQHLQLAKALVLKFDSRLTQKVQAQELLTQLVNTDIKYQKIKTLAMIHLSDLLLAEFKMYNETAVLTELQFLVQKLYGLGQIQKIFPLVIHALIFQSKLAVINEQFEQAIKLLNQAFFITEENGLFQLKEQVEEELGELKTQEMIWKRMNRNNAPMGERIEQANLQRSISNLSSLNIPIRPNVSNEEIEKYLDQIPSQLREEIRKTKEKSLDV